MLNYQGSSNNEVHQRALIRAYGGGNVRFPHLNEGKPQFDVPKGKSLSNSHASHGLYNLTGVTNPGFDCSVHSLGGPHYRATPRLGMPSPNWSTPRLGMPLPNWSTPHLGMPSPNWSTPSFDNPSLHDYVDFGKDCNTSRSGSFVGSSLHHSRSSIGGCNNQPFVMSSGHLPRMEDKVWETSAPFGPSFSFPECNAPPRSQFGSPVDRFDPPKIGTHKSQMAVSHTTSTGYKNENAIIYGSTISCNTEKSLNCDGKLGKSVSGKESNEIASLMASSGGQNSSLDSENQVTHMEPGEIKNNAALKKDQDVKGQSDHKKIKSDFHFRLVAFVKEAVKPFWKAGKLSKDAHNYIVKKTVDKILASLKPHEIPATEELMNDYMIKHEQEIKNLVKVYVDQDGKFRVSDYYVSKLTA